MFSLFTKKAPNQVFIAMLLGIFAGFGIALVIPLLMNVIKPASGGFSPVRSDSILFMNWEISEINFAVMFLTICFSTLIIRTIAQVILIRISVAVTTDLRTQVYQAIAAAQLAKVERVGPSRLMAVLTADVPRIVGGARLLPELLTSAMTLVGLFLFLYYLNSDVFKFVMISILVGVITYQIPMVLGRRYLVRSRHHLDGLHEGIRGLVYGFKELKLSKTKRHNYFEEILLESEKNVRQAQRTGQSILRVAFNYGSLISFFIIGAVSFVVINHSSLSKSELVGVIMILLYISGPVGMLLGFIPQLMSARISYRKLQGLLEALPSEKVNDKIIEPISWNRIRFNNIKYEHKSDGVGSGFVVGPVSFELKRNEITFIIGGNGSGKSTLSKLISLHYIPDDGQIYFGDILVDDQMITTFRQTIAVIYSDYYLFTRLLGNKSVRRTNKVNHYLEVLGLSEKVKFEDGEFSTLSLSDGQRRRLALLVAFVEDRDLYVFDEWAADQDPKFKEVFYREILQELRMQGKAVVVISHDDRYFELADRVIHMDGGKIREVIEQETGADAHAASQIKPRIVVN